MTKYSPVNLLLRIRVIELLALLAATVSLAAPNTEVPRGVKTANLILNGDFEATNALAGWSLIAIDGAQGDIACDTTVPSGENNSHSLRITVTKVGSRCGVVNRSSRHEMRFQAGQWYDFNFRARTGNNKRLGLVVSLESKDGKTVCGRATIPEVGGEWADYTLAIATRQSTPKGRLVIAMFEPGIIWLDSVSLTRRKTSE